MDLRDYQTQAARTANGVAGSGLNFTLGLCGEAGEVAELVKKAAFHGRRLSLELLTEELGDVLWYVAALAGAYGLSLEGIAKYNIAKLRKRYPDGFTKEGE